MLKRHIYIPVKQKTNILGLWIDNNKKIYRDNIKIKNCSSSAKLQLEIALLIEDGEQAVFYVVHNAAYIHTQHKPLKILIHRIEIKEKNLRPSYIKLLLAQHGGLTIFRKKNSYLIEIWK